MADLRQSPDTNKQPLIPPPQSTAAKPSESQVEHTVGRPADVPKVRAAPTVAWLSGIIVFVLLGVLLLWLLPSLASNHQEEEGIRGGQTGEADRVR